MVYNAFAKIPHHLQSTCLLCRCHISSPATDSGHFFGLCHYCQADLPFITACCRQCSIPLPHEQPFCGECLDTTPAFDRTLCAVSYNQQISGLIHRFKTRHDNAIGRLLAELLLEKLQVEKNTVDGALVDVIIATPMYWQRNLQRGNNHSYLLAKYISRVLQLPLYPSLLQRHRPTPVQKALTAKQRKKNLKGAFSCSLSIAGLRIAVIDDVMTTGSTMNEMAKTLKAAGASEVHCWAIARTPKY